MLAQYDQEITQTWIWQLWAEVSFRLLACKSSVGKPLHLNCVSNLHWFQA